MLVCWQSEYIKSGAGFSCDQALAPARQIIYTEVGCRTVSALSTPTLQLSTETSEPTAAAKHKHHSSLKDPGSRFGVRDHLKGGEPEFLCIIFHEKQQ